MKYLSLLSPFICIWLPQNYIMWSQTRGLGGVVRRQKRKTNSRTHGHVIGTRNLKITCNKMRLISPCCLSFLLCNNGIILWILDFFIIENYKICRANLTDSYIYLSHEVMTHCSCLKTLLLQWVKLSMLRITRQLFFTIQYWWNVWNLFSHTSMH